MSFGTAPEEDMLKSCYVLELSVGPGGARLSRARRAKIENQISTWLSHEQYETGADRLGFMQPLERLHAGLLVCSGLNFGGARLLNARSGLHSQRTTGTHNRFVISAENITVWISV